jgi:hypothetical protein
MYVPPEAAQSAAVAVEQTLPSQQAAGIGPSHGGGTSEQLVPSPMYVPPPAEQSAAVAAEQVVPLQQAAGGGAQGGGTSEQLVPSPW